MRDDFKYCVEQVFSFEGGYSNDRDDLGGETNWGITIATARRAGYTKPMKLMTRDEAEAIYKKLYWDVLRLDDVIDRDICLEMFDSGVNMGQSWPVRFLQRALNALNNEGKRWNDIVVDGRIGPKTVTTLNSALPHKDMKECILKAMNGLQTARYIELAEKREKNEKYVKGWLLHRVSRVIQAAQTWKWRKEVDI